MVRAALPPLLALLGYAAAALFPSVLLGDADTYWHLSTAEWMVRHRAVPHADPFSGSMPGAPWTDHEWGAELLLWLAWKGWGWPGVAALGAASFGLALGLLAAALLRLLPPAPSATPPIIPSPVPVPGLPALLTGGAPLAAALTGLAGVSAGRDLYARPHLLALPLLVLWAAELVQARAGARPPRWRFLPVMIVWANLHGSFVLGLLLVPPLAAEAWLAGGAGRWRALGAWLGFGAAAAAVTLATPNGAAGLLHPFVMLRMPVMAGFIEEWRSPDFHLLQPLEPWLLLMLLLLLLRGVRVPLVRAGLLLLLLHMALVSRRHAVVLGFLGPLLLAAPLAASAASSAASSATSSALARAASRSGVRGGAWAGAVALAALLAVPLLGGARPDDGITPEAAVAAVPPSVRASPVLNEYDFGGYLVFAGLRPFIDGRADMYGEAFLAEYQRAMAPDLHRLARLLRDRGIGWTLLRSGDPAASLLDALSGWQCLHRDEVAVVHARTELLGGRP